jgi:hypothetical protein
MNNVDELKESQFKNLNKIDLQSDKDFFYFKTNEENSNEKLWNNIDLMREQMDSDKKQLDKNDVEIEFVAGATISITAGFVSWVLRGGALLSSLLSSVSLFKQFDPLAVVFNKTESKAKQQETDKQDKQDNVEAMFDKNNE